MRKIAEVISLIAVAFQFWITYDALYGSNRLPPVIPVHFGIDGQPNRSGSPAGLFLLPAITLASYLLMTVAALFPVKMNLPITITDENLPRLQALSRSMLAWIKVEMVSLFVWIQWAFIQAARRPQHGFFIIPVPLIMAVALATVACFILAIMRAGRARPEPHFQGPDSRGTE
jgi:uncharacterized membrane protein